MVTVLGFTLRSILAQDVSDAKEAAPAVIREEPLLTLWYRPDKALCTPKAVVCVACLSWTSPHVMPSRFRC